MFTHYEEEIDMHAAHHFDALYRDLAGAWVEHQELRLSHGSLSELSEAAIRLDQARAAMRDWHFCHDTVVV